MHEVVLDFETASAVDLPTVGAWRYSEDITTEVISLSYQIDGGEPVTWAPGGEEHNLVIMAADPGFLFVAHNAGFEKAIWRNIMVAQYHWPDVPNNRWDDTQACCAMKAIPANLDQAVLALRLPQHKDKEGSKITKSLSKPDKRGRYDRSPETLERVYVYNRQDCRATYELRNRLGGLTKGERNVWLLDQRINERGVSLDLAFITKAQEVVDRASAPLVEEFKELTGGLKPTQNKKFLVWLNENGITLNSLAKEGVAKLLGETEDEDDGHDSDDLDVGDIVLPPLPRRALVIRSLVGSASVKKLKRMSQCVCTDGRARGLLQYHGASPGRWAGRLLQPHNFPRGTLKDARGEKPGHDVIVPAVMSGDPGFVELAVGPAIETVVSSLRHAIIAAPGRQLVSGDFATVEARIVLALAGQFDKCLILAQGRDIYCDMAGSIYNRVIDKKKDPEERQVGKNSVLGLGFQMGWKKFQAKYGNGQDDSFCQRVVKVYRETWAPRVPKVWYGLDEAATQTVNRQKPHEAFGVLYQLEDGWLTARLPSGRKLWYFNPQPSRRAVPWDETDVRAAWTYQQVKKKQLITIDAFGGLLTENVVQALARDLMVSAMFKLEANGFPIILTVHDEIVCEPLTKDADQKILADIMCDMPEWAKQMKVPVAVETWVGDRYRK